MHLICALPRAAGIGLKPACAAAEGPHFYDERQAGRYKQPTPKEVCRRGWQAHLFCTSSRGFFSQLPHRTVLGLGRLRRSVTSVSAAGGEPARQGQASPKVQRRSMP